MAGNHSRYQRGIIQRYYEHGDTIALQRLSELVSDLYLAEGNTAARLWKTAATSLAKLAPADDPRVAKVLREKNITGLAKLVGDLSAAGSAKAASSSSSSASSSSSLTSSPIIGESSPPLAANHAPAPSETSDLSSSPAREAGAEETAAPTSDQLKAAMKSFRKRLKLTKLDEESKLGRNPMSGGKKSGIVAIIPPREYPRTVWDELAAQGKLRNTGQGFFELVE